jgi:ribonuclease T2
MARQASILFIALLALSATAQAKKPRGEPGEFDYYAMSLSWSPAFCATRNDPDQCERPRPLGFVLHGLWPQYANGFPQSCSSERLPGPVRTKYALLFPSPKLIEHEWKKHGTCSGLDAAAYFELSARLKDKLVIPGAYQTPDKPVRTTYAGMAQAFKAANPALVLDAVLPFCGGGGRFLREVRVCYSKQGAYMACSPAQVKLARKSCGQESFLLQSIR